MARSNKLKAEAYIKLENGEEVLWYTIDENGEIVWHLPEEKAKEYKRRMMKRVGENMSLYLSNHPEAGMWGKTN